MGKWRRLTDAIAASVGNFDGCTLVQIQLGKHPCNDFSRYERKTCNAMFSIPLPGQMCAVAVHAVCLVPLTGLAPCDKQGVLQYPVLAAVSACLTS